MGWFLCCREREGGRVSDHVQLHNIIHNTQAKCSPNRLSRQIGPGVIHGGTLPLHAVYQCKGRLSQECRPLPELQTRLEFRVAVIGLITKLGGVELYTRQGINCTGNPLDFPLSLGRQCLVFRVPYTLVYIRSSHRETMGCDRTQQLNQYPLYRGQDQPIPMQLILLLSG